MDNTESYQPKLERDDDEFAPMHRDLIGSPERDLNESRGSDRSFADDVEEEIKLQSSYIKAPDN